MKNKQNNLGEQFKNAVSDALSTGDFKELNILVTDTVTDAISEASRQVKNASAEAQKNVQQDIKKQQEQRKNFSYEPSRKKQTAYGERTIVPKKTALPSTKVKNIGQVSSILHMVFGGIGAAGTILFLLIGLILSKIGFVWPTFVFILLFLGLGGSILAIRKGLVEKDRLNRMKRYIAICAGKMYINISDLAQQAGKSTKYVLKDIKKMLKLGFFPEGHLDEKDTCLMLDDATYREYLKTEKERKVLEEQEAAKKMQRSKNTNQELEIMLSEGHDYIKKLHEMNDLIEGEIISQKLYRMEQLLYEIFERVEEDPTQMPRMHKLMNYYLPTTIKLLQTYEEFDNISSPNAEIIAAKQEIEKTVDTINEAFTELLNKLFQSTVFDVTADAQVLQTMLAKEGLTKNDFSEDK